MYFWELNKYDFKYFSFVPSEWTVIMIVRQVY